MKYLTIILFLLSVSSGEIYSQCRVGLYGGATTNFLTVNKIGTAFSFDEYLGLGFKYRPKLSYNIGGKCEIDITKKFAVSISAEYMDKKIRAVSKSEPDFGYDIHFHFFRTPFVIKYKKNNFYYSVGLINNFLLSYNKDNLYQTTISQNIQKTNEYQLAFTFGIGYTINDRFEIYLKGQSDITPFLLTTDYGGDFLYPFKLHNLNLGILFWVFKNKQNY